MKYSVINLRNEIIYQPRARTLRRKGRVPSLCKIMNIRASRAVCRHGRYCVTSRRRVVDTGAGRWLSSASSTSTSSSGAADEEEATPPRKAGDVRRLISEARPEAHLVAGAVATIGVTSSISLAFPWAVGQILDASVLVATGTAVDDLVGWSANELTVALLGLFAVQGGLVVARNVLVTLAGERVVQRLRLKLFHAVLSQEVAFFDRNRTGVLINRLSADTTLVQKAVTSNVVQALRSAFTGIGGVAMMVTTSPALTALVLATVPPIALGARWFGGFIKERQTHVQDALAQATVVSEEAIANIRTVRAFGAEPIELERYRGEVSEGYRLSLGAGIATSWFDGAVHTAFNGCIVGLLYCGGGYVAAGTMSAGDLAAFMMYASFIGLNVSSLSTTYSSMMRAVGASSRIFEIVDREPLVPSMLPPMLEGGSRNGEDAAMLTNSNMKSSSASLTSTSAGAIEFRDVSFAYPNRPDVKILDGFSLRVEPGTSLALVGASGCGKSTAVSLLMRLYNVDKGSVLIDGESLGDADGATLHKLRGKMAVVNQEPALFATSIRDNIRYGSEPGVTEDEIEAAARAASADTFINDFPDGLDTLVGERGVQLSGGQKQRVAIARAIARKAPIVLLDEATSALDAESEHLVVEALDALVAGDRTVISIAHRLSTMRAADVIAVVRDGRVVEVGHYDALVAKKDSELSALVQRQLERKE